MVHGDEGEGTLGRSFLFFLSTKKKAMVATRQSRQRKGEAAQGSSGETGDGER